MTSTLGAPIFRSGLLCGGPAGGMVSRRPLGRPFTFSLVAHAGAGVVLVVISLTTVDQIPPPPIVIQFIPAPPPPPTVASLRAEDEVPEPGEMVPMEIRLPPVVITRAEPRALPEPPPIEVEAMELPTPMVEPEVPLSRYRDLPPGPKSAAPRIDRVDVSPAIHPGTGEAPDLLFLVPGEKKRSRAPAGTITGRGDGLPRLAAADGLAGRGQPGGGATGGGLAEEGAFRATPRASVLGKKYGVTLVAASRLGQRTSDGARYSLLIPQLSETYRRIGFRGLWRAPSVAPVRSAQVDDDAIAIHYRDGTVHVIVPTRDGLVGLYVSSGSGPPVRSKVDEAERALDALIRLTGTGGL